MRKALLDILVCPFCLPEEKPLEPSIQAERSGDIIEGALFCPRCKKSYSIKSGVAFLDPGRWVAIGALGALVGGGAVGTVW